MRNSAWVSLLFAPLLFGANVFAQSHKVTLSWTPAQQPSGITIASWNVLRGTMSGGPYTQLANVPVGSTTYVDSAVSSGTDYYYVVEAVDTDGVSSANCAELEVIVPTSAPPLAVATSSLPPATVGTSYNTTVTASGGTGPYTWSGSGVDGLTFSATGVLSGTPSAAGSFTQSVTVNDSAGNTASASLSLSVAPDAGSSLAFVQVNSAVPQGQNMQIGVPFIASQTAGDLNVVVVGWNDATARISSVTDSMGNSYALAVGPTVQAGTATQTIYYAKNIVAAPAGGNTVTVMFNTGAYSPDVRIAEYSGVDPTNPVDVVAAAQGTGTLSSSGSVTTTNANDLLIGANLVQQGTTGPGAGYTSRVITNPDSDILEDEIVSTAGSYSATAPLNGGAWIMQMIAFRAAGSGTEAAPAITSVMSTTFVSGNSGSFTVTATGSPTPSLTESGALPTGVTFADNGNGTAALSGTPAAGADGTYPLTFTASNGVGTPATQNFTLTVDQSPSFTSANNTTFTEGSAGAFSVTTTGLPAPSLTESGTLPAGVTFTDNGNGTATLSGTPAAGTAGEYSLTFIASNGMGTPASQAFTLTVSSASGSGSSLGFVQVNSAVPQGQNSQVAVIYAAAQTAGDLNMVVVGWHDSIAKISSITDSMGNSYALAVGPTLQSGLATQSIYYATNIAAAPAAGNTVTVVFNTGANSPDIRIAEYSGVDPNNPVDVVAAAKGSGTVSNSHYVTTTNAHDLLVGANLVQQGTIGPGSGYTSRVITSPDGDILEDRIVTVAGSHRATAQITGGAWIMQMVAFRAAAP
jgi:hypothetical protein